MFQFSQGKIIDKIKFKVIEIFVFDSSNFRLISTKINISVI